MGISIVKLFPLCLFIYIQGIHKCMEYFFLFPHFIFFLCIIFRYLILFYFDSYMNNICDCDNTAKVCLKEPKCMICSFFL